MIPYVSMTGLSAAVFSIIASVHQKSWHEQDCEKSDQSRKKNSESGHGNLRYFQRTSVPKWTYHYVSGDAINFGSMKP